MGNMDDYLELTSIAKTYGGPEKYIEFLQSVSKDEGKAEGIVIGAAITVTIGGTAYVIKKGSDYFKKKKKKKNLEKCVKQELINNMNEAAKNEKIADAASFDSDSNDLFRE